MKNKVIEGAMHAIFAAFSLWVVRGGRWIEPPADDDPFYVNAATVLMLAGFLLGLLILKHRSAVLIFTAVVVVVVLWLYYKFIPVTPENDPYFILAYVVVTFGTFFIVGIGSRVLGPRVAEWILRRWRF